MSVFVVPRTRRKQRKTQNILQRTTVNTFLPAPRLSCLGERLNRRPHGSLSDQQPSGQQRATDEQTSTLDESHLRDEAVGMTRVRLKWLRACACAAVLLFACDSTYSFQPTLSCRSLASSGRSLESQSATGRQPTRLRLAVKSSVVYVGVINLLYITRRSYVRDMSKRKLFRIRITREDGVSTRFYLTNLLAWQLFVTFIWPVSEPLSRILGYVSFYYSYPNASGVGVIFEPINVQHLSMSKRTKKQLRLDWHRFAYVSI